MEISLEDCLNEARLVVCQILNLEKERSQQTVTPFNYSNREIDSIKKLAWAIENYYLPIKPEGYSDTYEHREFLSSELGYHDKVVK